MPQRVLQPERPRAHQREHVLEWSINATIAWPINNAITCCTPDRPLIGLKPSVNWSVPSNRQSSNYSNDLVQTELPVIAAAPEVVVVIVEVVVLVVVAQEVAEVGDVSNGWLKLSQPDLKGGQLIRLSRIFFDRNESQNEV
jgi:hypothetical protein